MQPRLIVRHSHEPRQDSPNLPHGSAMPLDLSQDWGVQQQPIARHPHKLWWNSPNLPQRINSHKIWWITAAPTASPIGMIGGTTPTHWDSLIQKASAISSTATTNCLRIWTPKMAAMKPSHARWIPKLSRCRTDSRNPYHPHQ